MSKKRYSAEEIIQHLRTIELEQSKGVGAFGEREFLLIFSIII